MVATSHVLVGSNLPLQRPNQPKQLIPELGLIRRPSGLWQEFVGPPLHRADCAHRSDRTQWQPCKTGLRLRGEPAPHGVGEGRFLSWSRPTRFRSQSDLELSLPETRPAVG